MNKDSNYSNLFLRYIGKTTLIAAAYFLTNLLVLFFISSQNLIPLIWPQVGVALAVILLAGFDALPGTLIGSFLIAVTTGAPIGFSVILAVGNSLAAFFSAYYILAKNNFSYALENVSSIFRIIFLGVLFSPVISATINLIGMYLIQINIGEDLLLIWGTKWLRDALGVLLFTPFILVWFGNPLPKINTKLLIDEVLIYSAAVGLVLLIFFGNLNQETASSIIFLIIPIIIWASIKLNIHGLVSINLIISLLFLWGVANQKGALFNREVFYYPTFLFVLSTMWVTSLILSSYITRYQKTQNSLSDLSNRDKLTNLYNRLFFDTELERLDKSRQFPISIIMSDMDNLKEVNDTFGHSTGDQLLKDVALLLSLSFRLEDIIARIGGDEFVVLLPTTDAPGVKIIIERMKNRIDAYNIKHSDLPIHISLGVSTAEQGDSLHSHLKTADDLMYADKAGK
ncbi:MAG: diguanylate cyclase [Anaerolineaceae bacterium]|nr:diguanylate cyclase [Anaerolineaceae bacterium]